MKKWQLNNKLVNIHLHFGRLKSARFTIKKSIWPIPKYSFIFSNILWLNNKLLDELLFHQPWTKALYVLYLMYKDSCDLNTREVLHWEPCFVFDWFCWRFEYNTVLSWSSGRLSWQLWACRCIRLRESNWVTSDWNRLVYTISSPPFTGSPYSICEAH